jgi:threonine synthase
VAGVVRSDERVVALVTGHGLKTVEALTGSVGPTCTIAPTLEAFDEAMAEANEPAARQ